MTDVRWNCNLIRALLNGRLVVFFGAGLGEEYELPNWKELTSLLIKEFERHPGYSDYKKTIEHLLNAKQYSEVIDYLKFLDLGDGTDKVTEAIDRVFSEPRIGEITTNQDLLFELKVPIYLTTNVDETLEHSKQKAGKKRAKIFSYDDEKDIKSILLSNDLIDSPLIVRLHGELKSRDSLVFSKEQYSDVLMKMNREHYFFSSTLPAILNTYTILFVGYGLEDPDVNILLRNFNIIPSHAASVFWLQFDKDIDVKKVSDIKKFGIQVIELDTKKFDGNRTESLKEVLKDLKMIQNGIEREDKREVIRTDSKLEKYIEDVRVRYKKSHTL